MLDKPAILGGKPIFEDGSFKLQNTLDSNEREAVMRVMDQNVLSDFVGAWVPEFFGGQEVQRLEKNWCEYFHVKHSVSVNSATSGLIAAVGAIGIEPGDEIITTPTTMTATSASILIYHGIPIFADICPNTFCIDPKDVERKITEKTKAILAVNIYGETANWDELRRIANDHNLKLIEDAAQSAGGEYNGKKSGTLGDIGIFSLNRHKLIQCGEGGICVTNDDDLAERLQLIRNHAEAVVEGKKVKNLSNLVGYNFRMTELEAAIANEQLKKLEGILDHRRKICRAIINQFAEIKGILPPTESPLDNCCRSAAVKHTYYYLCFKIDHEEFGISRAAFVEAMRSEGIPFEYGGYRPLYFQPLYQQKIAFGNSGYPFTAPYYGKSINYNYGICPIAERMWFNDLIYFPIDEVMPTLDQVNLFGDAFKKIFKYKKEIEEVINDKNSEK